MRSRRVAIGLAACTFLLSNTPVQTASADPATYVSINPMTCTPTLQTFQDGKYAATAGRVKFKPGAIGTIVLLCRIGPIPSPTNREDRGAAKADAVSLTMHYFNQTSSGSIRAQVRRADLRTGQVSNLLEVESSALAGTPGGFVGVSQSGGKFDFTKFTYWVQVTLTRDRIEMSQPDDVGTPSAPRERGMSLLNLGLKIAKIRR